MKSTKLTYIKNILLPCLIFSVITGICTGIFIFLFKNAAAYVCRLSEYVFSYLHSHPSAFLPVFFISLGIGLLISLILTFAKDCRGGGIPTSVAILRGLIDFNWIKSVFILFISAMLTYLCGIPLGTEGPGVQMGTALGRGTAKIFGKKNTAWDRYIMTGGACAGFACATGAPVTGIMFAFEEAHRRFSPMIFMAASMTVISGCATNELLCQISGTSSYLFNIKIDYSLPLKYLLCVLTVGIICGICAILFTKLYRIIGIFVKEKLKKIPLPVKIMAVSGATCLSGFAFCECIGTGHSLTEAILEGHGVWYMLILYFCIRAILLIFASRVGVSGGLFVPSLTFGAIIGSVCAQAMTYAGILPAKYHAIITVVGMVSFLGASARTPITAVIFALEVLGCIGNILPIAMGVTFAFLVIEVVGVPSFNDTVIESKVESANRDKVATIVNTNITVAHGSFAVGKEIRDILWPPTCTVLSVQKNPNSEERSPSGLSEGDILHVHYQTYDPSLTYEKLEAIVGVQSSVPKMKTHTTDKNHSVPEL